MKKGTIKERVAIFLHEKCLKMGEFEKMCGLSSGYIASMRKGFGSEKLNNVLTAFPDLNRDWLLYGEGEMLKKSVNAHIVQNVEQTNRNGDNNNFSTVNKADDKLLAELANAHKLTENAQEQTAKAQQQMDRLISIIEKMQNNH